jgi:hypothetical protein
MFWLQKLCLCYLVTLYLDYVACESILNDRAPPLFEIVIDARIHPIQIYTVYLYQWLNYSWAWIRMCVCAYVCVKNMS